MLEDDRMCNADVLEDKMSKNKHLQKIDYIMSLHFTEGVAYGNATQTLKGLDISLMHLKHAY